jgi:hypothetical protein
VRLGKSCRIIKEVKVTKEAFSSQKRTSSTSKHEILWIIFALLDPDPDPLT